jgi:hypothetical protein
VATELANIGLLERVREWGKIGTKISEITV